jgi:hypothetical protein
MSRQPALLAAVRRGAVGLQLAGCSRWRRSCVGFRGPWHLPDGDGRAERWARPEGRPGGLRRSPDRALEKIRTADHALEEGIWRLAHADQEFTETSGAPAAERAVRGAARGVDAVVPGAVA